MTAIECVRVAGRICSGRRRAAAALMPERDRWWLQASWSRSRPRLMPSSSSPSSSGLQRWPCRVGSLEFLGDDFVDVVMPLLPCSSRGGSMLRPGRSSGAAWELLSYQPSHWWPDLLSHTAMACWKTELAKKGPSACPYAFAMQGSGARRRLSGPRG